MLALVEFACREFGWSWRYAVEEASLLSLVLLMRQRAFSEGGGKGLGLDQQEELDRNAGRSWSELVAENRARMAPQLSAIRAACS